MKKYFILLLVIPLSFSNCNDNSDDSEPRLATLPPVNVVDISQESQWDYMVFGGEDYYFIKANSSSNLPQSVLYYSATLNENFSIFFSENGNIDKVVFREHIFIFRNFDGNYVDLGVVYPNQQIEILRQIHTPNYDWDSKTLKKASSLKDFKSELIRWTGHTIAGIPCALSAAAAIPTGGLSLIGAGVTCGVFLTRLVGDIAESDFNVKNNLNELATTYDVAATLVACVTLEGIECSHGVFSITYDFLAESHIKLENSPEEINLVEGSLENGYGDVQITLTWNNGADLDLFVEDPYGEQIWWNHDSSNSQGKLDIDDTDGYGPENIFWPHLQAPMGIYKVYVYHYTSSPYQSNYKVLINAFGKTKTFSGSIKNEELIHIADFDQNNIIASQNKLDNAKQTKRKK